MRPVIGGKQLRIVLWRPIDANIPHQQGNLMKQHLFKVLAPLLLLCGAAQGQDEFAAVHCGSDIPHALVGKRSSNEPVEKTVARHSDLGLKALGGDEVSDELNSESWAICGSEFMLLTDKHGVVKDALSMPAHSRASPEFGAGFCKANGKAMAGLVVAILDNQAAGSAADTSHYTVQDDTLVPAKSAWKIDEKTGKFAAISASGLSCPRSGIITTDGGP
jgi:hypothetical protein